MSNDELGIRVFLEDGTYEDFDPIDIDLDVEYQEDTILINSRWYFKEEEVNRIVSYVLRSIQLDGYTQWTRLFEDELDLREDGDGLL